MILSNGEALDDDLLKSLKKAGLVKMSFHIDSGQTRKGWTGKNEKELNQLRQKYVDMLWNAGIKCNFNITVTLNNFRIIRHCFAHAAGSILENRKQELERFHQALSVGTITDREGKIVKTYFELTDGKVYPSGAAIERLRLLSCELLAECGHIKKWYDCDGGC